MEVPWNFLRRRKTNKIPEKMLERGDILGKIIENYRTTVGEIRKGVRNFPRVIEYDLCSYG